MSQSREQTRRRRYYEKHASSYDGWMRYYDRAMLGDGRVRLCSRAVGRTLELAVGTGLNLSLYPQNIHLTGIDLSPAMLAIAEQRAHALGISADLHVGDAHALNFPDNHFDTVISTLALSTIPDARRAAAEAGRVLKPNGLLLLLDHVRSPFTPVRWIQRLIHPILVRRTGVDLRRDPIDYLAAVGFIVEHSERSRFGIVEQVVAHKSDQTAPS